MDKINFNTEYNKLLHKTDEYKKTYEDYLKYINIKLIVNLLNTYDIFDNPTLDKLNEVFNLFIIKKNESDIKHVPYIKDEKQIKIKRKNLMKYIHPDKILLLYGNDNHIKYISKFSEVFIKMNNDINLSSEDILVFIYNDNEDLFNIIVNKLSENKLISNNEIKYIKTKVNNNIVFKDIKISETYDIFPIYINMFVRLHNMLEAATPINRFVNDIYIIINSIFNFIKEIIKDKNIKLYKSKHDLLPNIMQIFKINKMNKYIEIMLILNTYLPHCYIKLIEIFKVNSYLGTIYISSSYISNSDFLEAIKLDFIYGSNKYSIDMIKKLYNNENIKEYIDMIGLMDTYDNSLLSMSNIDDFEII